MSGARQNTGSRVTGAAYKKVSAQDDLAAFDGLPETVRRVMRDASFQYAATTIADHCAKFGAAAVIEAILDTDQRNVAAAYADRGASR